MVLPWDKLVRLALGGYDDLLKELFSDFRDASFFPDPVRYLLSKASSFGIEFADLLADLGMAATINGAADPFYSLTIKDVPVIRDWREKYYQNISQYPKTWLWDGITFPSNTPAFRPVTQSAVKALKSWNVVSRKDFDRLRRIEKSRSWTITNINSQKARLKIRESLSQALQQGSGRIDWYKTVRDEFDKSRLGPAAAELVFRVAATKAWHEGQARIIKESPIGELFPYVNVITINDSRRSLACAMMAHSGLDKTSIYNRDDPAYLKNRTPRHYNCRCRDSFLTVAQAARMGVLEAQEWLKSGKRPVKFEMVPYFEVPMPKGWIPLSLKV